ncbi:hypothetical protein B0T24DRAFT_681842 [Lasiosphaeria ovina]|uniref:Uncharacterized protein n=1 Tax=Lasiosphaeria ovina TaxID=92902 RepID=A0AAE0JZ00_9PEZI|nr:hypothetical protein B0T24DRAFT_681842 [Lasiosphaeria ovina]
MQSPSAPAVGGAPTQQQRNTEIKIAEVRWILEAQRRKFHMWQETGRVPGVRWDSGLKQWILGPAAWNRLIRRIGKMRVCRGASLPWLDLSIKLWGVDIRDDQS